MPKTIHLQNYNAPCGGLVIGSYAGALILCEWATSEKKVEVRALKHIAKYIDAKVEWKSDLTLIKARRLLDSYFSGKRKKIKMKLLLTGTPFQKHAWETTSEIPYGERKSYAAVAKLMGEERAARALSNAMAANPIVIFVPCHRVVGNHNTLIGYSGGIRIQEFLLTHEEQALHPTLF